MTRRIKFETKDAPGEVTLEDVTKAIQKHAATTQGVIDELKAANTKLTDDLTETKANLLELEQKMADPEGIARGNMGGGPDLADSLFKNEHVQAVAAHSNSKAGDAITVKTADLFGIERKSTTTQNSDPLGPRGFAGIYAGLERARFVFDLVHKIPVTVGTVDTVRELSFTNNAEQQLAGSPLVFTEGASKAESDIVFESISLRLPTTAHFLKCSTQALADAAQLRALLDRRLRYGLLLKNDAQIIATIIANGNHTAFTPSSGDDAIASVNRAIVQAQVNESQPSVILLNPVSWGQIQRLRADGGDGQHLVGNPNGVTGENLWGVPVMVTNSLAAGKVIVADFMTAGEYFLRQDSVIELGYVDQDFTKNLVTIRGENRGAWQTIRPVAIQYGDLTL